MICYGETIAKQQDVTYELYQLSESSWGWWISHHECPAWGCSTQSHNWAPLPACILQLYCIYVDHWNEIEDVKPPIDPHTIIDCQFTEGLRKPAAEILTQDCTCWIVTIKYICNWLLIPSWGCTLMNYQFNLTILKWSKLSMIPPRT